MRVWTCKIGAAFDGDLKAGAADAPMRAAVADAYEKVTGYRPDFIFSGWAGELTEEELAVVFSREPAMPVAEVNACDSATPSGPVQADMPLSDMVGCLWANLLANGVPEHIAADTIGKAVLAFLEGWDDCW